MILDAIQSLCERCPLLALAERHDLRINLKLGWSYAPCLFCPINWIEDLILAITTWRRKP